MSYWRVRLPEISRGDLPDGRQPAPSPFPVESTDVHKLLCSHAFEVLLCQSSWKKKGTSESVNNSRFRGIDVVVKNRLFMTNSMS